MEDTLEIAVKDTFEEIHRKTRKVSFDETFYAAIADRPKSTPFKAWMIASVMLNVVLGVSVMISWMTFPREADEAQSDSNISGLGLGPGTEVSTSSAVAGVDRVVKPRLSRSLATDIVEYLSGHPELGLDRAQTAMIGEVLEDWLPSDWELQQGLFVRDRNPGETEVDPEDAQLER